MARKYWQYNKCIRANLKEKEMILRYEIWMFRNICKCFSNWNLVSQFQKNLLVEALAIHTRILVDFFYFNKMNKNDIVAQEFLPKNKNWARLRPSITRILENAKEKANKQLAHLSRWRVKLEKEGKKPWYHNKIWRDIEKLIKAFENASGINF